MLEVINNDFIVGMCHREGDNVMRPGNPEALNIDCCLLASSILQVKVYEAKIILEEGRRQGDNCGLGRSPTITSERVK